MAQWIIPDGPTYLLLLEVLDVQRQLIGLHLLSFLPPLGSGHVVSQHSDGE